ncbi:MAG: DUF4339 domain-containing protein [Lentisphaerae bacterium]|nr:DUF4339 domain-containing protein [Lentisphaerota bacterium]
MTPDKADTTPRTKDKGPWYLRIGNGNVYGPLDIAILKKWTAEGRIGPGNEVSKDQDLWAPVHALAELQMQWAVKTPEGTEFGPFSLLAVPSLLRRGILKPEAVLENSTTKKSLPIQSLVRGDVSALGAPAKAIADQIREMLKEDPSDPGARC